VPDGTDFLRGADRRLTAARADLAAAHLKGSVDSARFAEATPMQVKAAIIPLRPAPDSNVGIDTVLLFGESFDAYDVAEGWVWGQSKRDGYVGYVPQAALSPEVSETTHTVAVPATHLYPKADIKTEPVAALWMTSLVAPTAITEQFAAIDGLFLPIQHLAAIDDVKPDWVGVAETFLHAPYVWGGKTVARIDCSGLMQVALARAGIPAPRDSDMLVMSDADTLLHATAFSMRVMHEPLRDTRKRIETDLGLPLLNVRRL